MSREAAALSGMVNELYERQMIGSVPYVSSVLSAAGVLTPGEGIEDGGPLVAALYWPAISPHTGKVIDMVRTGTLLPDESASTEAGLVRRVIRECDMPDEQSGLYLEQGRRARELVEHQYETDQNVQFGSIMGAGLAGAPYAVVGLHRGAASPRQRVARLWAIAHMVPRLVLPNLKLAVDRPDPPR